MFVQIHFASYDGGSVGEAETRELRGHTLLSRLSAIGNTSADPGASVMGAAKVRPTLVARRVDSWVHSAHASRCASLA
jgi:hypothetical protein